MQARQIFISFTLDCIPARIRFPESNRGESSANVAILRFVDQTGSRSFIRITKRKGPKMEPLGTP